MVYEYFDKIFTNKDLVKNDYVFIWARRTDKVEENSIPNALKYYEILKEENLLNDRIIIQTDDKTMIDEFYELKFNFEYFNEIPFAKGYSFHRLISKMSDEEFLNDFNIDKNEYMTQIICIVLLALNAKKCMIYPGCGATVVPMYKNTFNNCLLFQNDTTLFK
jgi:galactose-1-phosphate uridylyltransferase